MAGGKDGILNPLVHNMVPAYEAARYDLIWVSTSRIAGEITEDRHVLRCELNSLNLPVGIVHNLTVVCVCVCVHSQY